MVKPTRFFQVIRSYQESAFSSRTPVVSSYFRMISLVQSKKYFSLVEMTSREAGFPTGRMGLREAQVQRIASASIPFALKILFETISHISM